LSQSHSLDGKLCFACSKSTFVLQDRCLQNTTSETSLQCEKYRCPSCGLIVEYSRMISQTLSTTNAEPLVALERHLASQ